MAKAKATKKAPVRKKTASTNSKATRKPVQKARTISAFEYLSYGLFSVAMAYGFASWAIDTGSLWLYFFCFVSIYFAVIYLRKFIVKQFIRPNKAKKSR